MPDAHFAVTRLAEIYDPLDPDRSDLDAYTAMTAEFGARRVADIGCGTGTLACRLARAGLDVIAADPALASLQVARRKPGADRVRWLCAGAADLPPVAADLAVMTANVAQVFVSDAAWASALAAARAALVPGGRLVFETRDPDRRAWQGWTRDRTERRVDVPAAGVVRTWTELTGVSRDLAGGDAGQAGATASAGSGRVPLLAGTGLVSFRTSFVFDRDGTVLTSDSTLRFRGCAEIAGTLAAAGFTVEEVREAPDRPGREFVFVARQPGR